MALDDRHEAEGRVFKVVGTRPIRPDGIDKVTGRARFGADMNAPGMLTGLVLRSPHAHARIRGIDTSKAEALPGVKAVVTSADFGEVSDDLRDVRDNAMAAGKALYDGHAVAAVAATNERIANAALQAMLSYRRDAEELQMVQDHRQPEGRQGVTAPLPRCSSSTMALYRLLLAPCMRAAGPCRATIWTSTTGC